MVREAIKVARAAGATGEILVRGDSAYGNSAVVGACVKSGVRFSVVLTKSGAVTWATGTIAQEAWTPVTYPGAVLDPDTGQLISDAEVAEIEFTAFASTEHPVTARLGYRPCRSRPCRPAAGSPRPTAHRAPWRSRSPTATPPDLLRVRWRWI